MKFTYEVIAVTNKEVTLKSMKTAKDHFVDVWLSRMGNLEEPLNQGTLEDCVRNYRRVGKTTQGAVHAVKCMLEGKRVVVVCPFTWQIKNFMSAVASILKEANYEFKQFNSSMQCIELLGTDDGRKLIGRIYGITPEPHKGQHSDVIIIDEAEHISAEGMQLLISLRVERKDTEFVTTTELLKQAIKENR